MLKILTSILVLQLEDGFAKDEQVNRLTHSRNDGNKSTNATFSVRVHNFVLVFIKSRESSKVDEQNSEQYESFLPKNGN